VGLTSGSLIGLAGFLAVTAIAGTMWLWPSVAGPRRAHVLARAGLLVWAQVTVMLVLFLSVNSSFGFFASWSDLLGTNHATGVIVTPPRPGGGEPARSQTAGLVMRAGDGRARGWPAAPLGGRDPARYGELRAAHITGTRSGISATAYVYLPPQYFDSGARAGGTFGVVIVISGHTATAGDPYGAVSVALTAARQIAAGREKPAIYVMLTPAVAAGRDRACLDVPGGPQAATFFSQDLPAAIRAAYHVSDGPGGWAVVGDASGGYCALSLAMAHSDRFSVAAAPLAPYGLPPGMTGMRPGSPGWWLAGGSAAIRDEDDLTWRLRFLPPQPVTVFFTRAPAAASVGADAWRSLARRPMRVAEITLAAAPQPLAPLLDAVTSALAASGPPAPRTAP
jgi:Putative esterase